MNYLAFETTTAHCSVALQAQGRVTHRHESAPNQHTRVFLSLVGEVLEAARISLPDLDFIAFGAGPGSFTGLRIGSAFAQGLALPHGIPLIPVDSLQTLGLQVPSSHEGLILVAQDAHMGKLYWGLYRWDLSQAQWPVLTNLAPPTLGRWDEMVDFFGKNVTKIWEHPESPLPLLGIGNGWNTYPWEAAFGAFHVKVQSDIHTPRAEDALRAALHLWEEGRFVTPEHGLPHYAHRVAFKPLKPLD